MEQQNNVLSVEQQIDVKAAPAAAFEALLTRLTEKMHVALKPSERFPGGRWYRDLGNNAGHLWGFVQVIKPPALLEICGPMMMSYPVSGHLQVRLTEVPSGTRVTLRHRAFGLIESDHREKLPQGWKQILDSLVTDFG